MNLFKQHSLFFGIFILCLVLRFLPLFEYQFTYDELSGLDRTQFGSFAELIEKGVKVDAHPALVQLMIFYTVKLAGYSEWLIKLPFLLFSLGAVIYGYLLAYRYFSRQAGLITALFMSFSLIFVFYAPIARMYIGGVFFSMALLYYFFNIVFGGSASTRNFFYLGLFALLSAFNQHINALFAASVFAAGFLMIKGKDLRPFLLTAIFTVILYLPHLPVTLYQLGVGGIGTEQGGWLEKPDILTFFDLIRVLLGGGYLYLAVATFIMFAFYSAGAVRLDKKQTLLLVLFVLNFLIVFLYSIYRASVYQHSVMLFAGCAFIVFIASLLQFARPVMFYSVFTILALMLLYNTYVRKDYFGQAVRTVFEEQFRETIAWKKQKGADQVLPLFFDADTLMKKIYFNKFNSSFSCRISGDSAISFSSRIDFGTGSEKKSSFLMFSELIAATECNYVLAASGSPRYHAVIRDRFPYLVKNVQTFGVNIKIFSRVGADSTAQVPDEPVRVLSFPDRPGDFVYQPADVMLHGAPLQIDSLNEFPFAAKAMYRDVISAEGEVVLSKAVLSYTGTRPKELESCVVVQNGQDKTTLSYNAKMASDYAEDFPGTISLYSDAYIGYHHRKKGKHQLQCYLWNKGREKVRLKSFEIRVIDYWHAKWNFWD